MIRRKTRDSGNGWTWLRLHYDKPWKFMGAKPTSVITLATLIMNHAPNLRHADGTLVKDTVYIFTDFSGDNSAVTSFPNGTVYVFDEVEI